MSTRTRPADAPAVPAHRYSAVRAVLREREAELLEIKGPCRTPRCPLHYAHRGPCDLPDGVTPTEGAAP